MDHESKTLVVLLLCSFWTIVVHAQETIPATGGSATGTGGSVSYTVGQIFYSTYSWTNGTVTQGVQQPYEISVVTTIENSSTVNLELIVYPNPTRGVVKLILVSFDNEELRFRLYDINGVLLQDKKIEGRETEILMDNLSSSIYFLKIINNNNELKVFKIIKN
jgi:hypothetical protein